MVAVTLTTDLFRTVYEMAESFANGEAGYTISLDYETELDEFLGYSDTNDPTVNSLSSTRLDLTYGDFDVVATGTGIGPVSTLEALFEAIDTGVATGEIDTVTIDKDGTGEILAFSLLSSGYTLTSGDVTLTISGSLPQSFSDIFDFAVILDDIQDMAVLSTSRMAEIVATLAAYDIPAIEVTDDGNTIFGFSVTTSAVELNLFDHLLTLNGTFPSDLGELVDLMNEIEALGGAPIDLTDYSNFGLDSLVFTDRNDDELQILTGPVTDEASQEFTSITFDGESYSPDFDIVFEVDDTPADGVVLGANDWADMIFGTFASGAGVGDMIDGFGGNDRIFAFDGDDIIEGGEGADTMTGGDGRDTFMADGASELDGDVITDFMAEDTLTLQSVLGSVTSVSSSVSSTVISVDFDGDDAADASITLQGDFTGQSFDVTEQPESTVEITLSEAEAAHDFTGDATSDILWRKSTGRVGFWEMHDGAATYHFLADVATSWTIQETGDFNGDGTMDILWRYTSGTVGYWEMQEGDETFHVIGSAGTDWTVKGTGDFNGDGTEDVLWRKDTGSVGFWEMDDGNETFHVIGYAGTNWLVEGIGDFNGDGTEDVLWRKDTGNVGYWEMDGGDATFHVIGYAGTNWTVEGTGDFNGDGTDDILWRKDTGSVGYWEMDGGEETFHVIGFAGTDWSVADTGDFNGDQTDDVLWRRDTGMVGYWEMENGEETFHVIANVGLDWDIV
ncbi:Alkaline phosphatase [Rhodovulum sp. P5]|uniref:FG-GAP repeat domain-containing protein n=1 Tax=Rhodovulum sp. P5 TaxID=1564506 RepID=UPI0009C39095|nr:VCBS repeat-containing protein [Rhodovulum sp. P5]ARE41524.1 Alkaline phosphatase [Rhodovulum sp. P5]